MWLQEPSKVGVTKTVELISPAWNQSRPWLTGSWVMSRPAAFLQEAGGSVGQELVPALMDLAQNPEAAEYLLVDDLLTVMMGQVRASAIAELTLWCSQSAPY
jgi:hypothetical protein